MSNTYIAVSCHMSDGSARVFGVDATDSTSAYATLVDVVTGNDIGDSAQGLSVIAVLSTCENFCYSPGVVFTDNMNNVIQSVGSENPEQIQPGWQKVNIPIKLNYKVKALTQATVA